ncbi:MAG: sugar ABC transporter ATP-binding protein [Bifidobacteriaceae bacterium]|jgi:putative multiple sugar transport system ATP-binding protein|nr:sugar ABC transporter ATP-binding protein [Bifidobacteriaceae bacterium]
MPSDGKTILEMRGISMEFPGVKALDDVTMTVSRGEIHAICGENGAGKSTLMKILSGVHPYGSFTGEVDFEGQPCQFRSIRDSERRGIAIIHQELALNQFLSIAENIFVGNEQATHGVIDWRKTEQRATEVMRRVGLPDSPNVKIADIGVGKQQLVEIAKALSKDVRLLILDEPTAALNDEDSAHLLGLMRQLRDEHDVSCIMITHKLNEILAVADTVTVIRDGKTVAYGDIAKEGITEEFLIRHMVGRPLENRYPEHTPNKPGAEVMRLEDWTVHHPIDTERKVADSVSLSVHAGEIVGLAGLMGAGRTELVMSMFGHTYGVGISGKVFINGKEVTTRTVSQAVHQHIAYCSEDRKRFGLNTIQSVKENITAAGLSNLARFGVIETLAETGIAETFREDLNIKTPSVNVPASKLSGGNQQKVVLAKWIYTSPAILILDEPTRGIDVGAKYEIYTIINRMADEGKAVLVISSELVELLGICDRIYTLSGGRITGNVPRSEATQESLMTLMTQEKEKVHR